MRKCYQIIVYSLEDCYFNVLHFYIFRKFCNGIHYSCNNTKDIFFKNTHFLAAQSFG